MKEIEPLFDFMANYIVVDEDLQSRILDITSLKRYPANAVIIQEGQYNRHFRYLHDGCVRYHANYDGKEVTTWIEVANQLLLSYDGFSFDRPGGETLEASADSVVIEIASDDFLKLLEEFPQMERFARLWLEKEMSSQLEFYKFFMFMSAKEKYKRLLTYVSDVDLKVKAIHIASFLGISPETLSRIRAEHLKSN
ncbi:Crp/Fnr family transcriptional regulator [Ancylomarina sp. DW003]|nr:Crp/Fnr family transcriptional regulator [Ancylomarina sp. DW003]MDE5423022.1 Crp/Fnr family transcriptional regulator [Ancylomarina sp. DW003]